MATTVHNCNCSTATSKRRDTTTSTYHNPNPNRLPRVVGPFPPNPTTGQTQTQDPDLDTTKIIRTTGSFIKSIPSFKVSSVPNAPFPSMTCCLCMKVAEPNDTLGLLPCMHVYHYGCMFKWLSENSMCILCGSEFPSETLCGHLKRYMVIWGGNLCTQGWGLDHQSAFWDAVVQNNIVLEVEPNRPVFEVGGN